MRVIWSAEFGNADVLKVGEAKMPEPSEGEVLIRVDAAGKYPPPPGASETLGLEVAGEIVARGPGAEQRWKIADRVCALVPGGGYAEYCVAHSGCCLRVPEGMGPVAAASLPEAAFTAWANLFDPHRLVAGERFLMQGGTSGIGTLAIQAARAFGASVAATAGSAEKCRFLLELGCERAFNYHEDDWVAGALEWSGGKGVDVVLDMVGGDYFAKHLKVLARDGRLVHIATSHGSEVSLDLKAVMAKRLVITGSTLRSRPVVQAGKVRPVVDQVFSLQDAAKAHKRMESGLHIGKIVLQVA